MLPESPGGYEVDFYLPETRELIQVSQNLAQPATRERETRALTNALAGLGLDLRRRSRLPRRGALC